MIKTSTRVARKINGIMIYKKELEARFNPSVNSDLFSFDLKTRHFIDLVPNQRPTAEAKNMAGSSMIP